MLTMLLSLIIILLAVLALAAATIVGKRPVRLGCRELADRAGGSGECPMCGKPAKR